jgi:hypothetical protein
MPTMPVSIKRGCALIATSFSLWGCASSVDMVRAAEEINAMRAQLDRATRDAQEAKKISEESRAIAADAKRSAEQIEAEFKAMTEASRGSEIRVLPVR